MPLEGEKKKKSCVWTILVCIVPFLAEVFFFMFEIPCVICWIVAFGITIWSKKKYKIWINVILLVISLLFLASNFYIMHLMPNHEYFHIEW